MNKAEKGMVDMIDKLVVMRSRLLVEIKTLNDRLAGVDMAIAALRGDDHEGQSPEPQSQPSTRRRNVKKTVMEIASEASAGVTAAEVVDRARAMGRDLAPSSVSSLLSKFKGDGVLRFDGERYYPAHPSAPAPEQPRPFTVVKGEAMGA
jgi:hypothetical protein